MAVLVLMLVLQVMKFLGRHRLIGRRYLLCRPFKRLFILQPVIGILRELFVVHHAVDVLANPRL